MLQTSPPDPPEAVYRAPENGDGRAHRHPVQKVTRKQLKISRTAEDGTLVGPEEEAGKACYLNRPELAVDGSVLHTPTRTRFYRSEGEAEAIG